jgi:CubicO group peptidase (beta-lactamase class C family)
LLTTAPDFARFLQLLLNGGALDNRRVLSVRSVEEIFVNQLADTTSPERQPGIGFGLGAAIVTRSAGYGVPSSDGLMFWSGSLNTRFWIHRAQQMVGVYFSQVEPFAHLDLMNDVMRANLPPPNPVDLELHGVLASTVKHEGRDALRLIVRDGRIDVDVAGRRGPHAKDDDRGFVGIAFRMAVDPLSYELIYIRPDNGRADDQLRRNRSTQYASYPDFPWQLLRKEYRGSRAQLFVGGASQPALVVNDLKLPSRDGIVALWIGAGSEAFFANVRVTSR